MELNSVDMSLALPPRKIEQFKRLLVEFSNRKRASRKQLERLCGKLSWASTVVKAGRTYLRRMFDLLRPLRKADHKCQLTAEFFDDVQWWINVMNVFPGK